MQFKAHADSFFEQSQLSPQKRGFEAEITRLQRQLEMTETEYKLVDKTRVKALQVITGPITGHSVDDLVCVL